MTGQTEFAEPEKIEGDSGYGRDFRLYATGQAVSVVGDRIALIVLVFLVIRLSRSYAPALALFYVCRVLPTLLGGLVAGVIADYLNRRRLMIGADLGRAALLVTVPGLTSLELGALYPMVLVLYALTVLFDTAANAALPDVVPQSRVIGANAILRGIRTAGDLAYGVGGTLVFALGLQAPFYIDAGTFLFSAVMISGMRIPTTAKGPFPRLGQILAGIRPGVEYMLNQPFLKWSTVTYMVAPFAGGVALVLSPLYAQHILAHSAGLVGPLRSGAFRFSVLEVSIGVGALLVSGLAPRLAHRWPRGRLFAVGVVGMGIVIAPLALTSSIYVAAALMAASGFFNSLFFISGTTLVQTLTPTELRGRVVSILLTVSSSSLALGSAAGGVLLLALPYATLWLVLGGMIAGASLFVLLQPDARAQL